MGNMPEPRKQYDAIIGDRKVPVFAATETQIAFLARFSRRADIAFKANKMEVAMQSIADILDLLDSLVVNQDDREYLTGRMMIGDLEAEEFIDAYANAIPESGEAPTPRVTRGRAK